MRKRTVVAAAVPLTVLAAGGVAWAVLGGTVALPDVTQGIANTAGGGSCQGVTNVNFEVPTPTWDNANGEFINTTLNYSNVTSVCVNLGTADLMVYVTNNGNTVTAGQATNMGSATGSITLNPSVAFADLTGATFTYLVSE